MKLLPDNLVIDFVGPRRIFAGLSVVLVTVSLALFLFVGPNWGIDFTGGTSIHFRFDDPMEISDIRGAVEKAGISADSVQRVGAIDRNEFVVRVADVNVGSDEMRADVEKALAAAFGPSWIREIRYAAEVGARMTVVYEGDTVADVQIKDALASLQGVRVEGSSDDKTFYVKLPGLSHQVESTMREALGGKTFEVLSVDSVGPKVGKELRTQGLISILAAMLLITVYVAFRFDMSFAPGAIIALFHDVMITVGIFVVLRRELDMSFIGVLLTIVGYSINDTIVVYDRIRENMKKYRRKDLPRLINDSMNEVFGRTLATSLTTFLAIVPFLFLGLGTIQNFALAMCIGLVVGTYSSIYIASPLMITLQGFRPAFSKLLVSAGGKTPEEISAERSGRRQTYIPPTGKDPSEDAE